MQELSYNFSIGKQDQKRLMIYRDRGMVEEKIVNGYSILKNVIIPFFIGIQ
jgi:hypothetical protein